MPKAQTFAAKLDDATHAAIQSSVADAHKIKPDAVSSSDDGANLKVVAKHDDGTTTTTTHALDDNGAVTDSEGDQSNANSDSEKAQINAVEDAVEPDDGDGEDLEPDDPPSKKAPNPFLTMGAIASHSTATDDEGSWDASANVSKINQTAGNLKKMHAYKGDGDPEAKSTYSYPHHNANDDGSVGAANTTACSSGIASINGGRGGHSMEPDEKKGVYNHLAKHIRDAGGEPPELKGGTGAAKASSKKTIRWSGKTAAGEAINVVDDGADPNDDNSFSMPIMVIEGEWTGDGRFITPGALSWRDLPLPAMALKSTTFGHDDAQLSGRIDSIERRSPNADEINSHTGQPFGPDTSILFANGKFDTSADAQEIKRLVNDGMLRGVSVDIGDAVSELVYLDADGNEIDDPYADMDIFDLLFGFSAAGDEETEPAETEPSDSETPEVATIGERITSGRIMGVTICPFPAFEGAYITIGDVSMAADGSPALATEPDPKWWYPSVQILDKQGERTVPKSQLESLVASGKLAAPMVPPVEWFGNPKLDGPSALTITPEGEIYGHLAIWGECHMSYTNQCINAPKSMSDYSYFRTGCVLCENDSLIPTGVITMNTGHAELWQDPSSTKAHYDNTGTVVADIAAGEDSHGIWVHGSLRPDVDELSVRRLRGAALSGDWRQLGGNLELVAALAVNVPGFAVRRPAARIAAGAPMALVAAGRVTQDDAIKLRNQKPAKTVVNKGYTQRDMDVLAGYVRRDLRSQVHNQNGR